MKHITIFCLIIFALIFSEIASAQGVAINEDNSSADNSAILDVKSIDKGVLIPRMTSGQRTAISGPVAGLLVYDLSTSSFWFHDGVTWVELTDEDSDDVNDADADPNNEIQSLSISSSTITLDQGGGSVTVPGDNLGNHSATTNLSMNNYNIVGVNSMIFADPGDQEGVLWDGSAAKIFVSPFNGGNSDGYLRLINDGGIVFEPGSEDVEQVTFLSNGNVGMGTTAPSAKLDVVGSFQLVNGSQGTGKILTSDASGNATWATPIVSSLVCRSGFWAVSDGRICMSTSMYGPAGMHPAIGFCKSLTPGCRVCKHTDFLQACGSGLNPYAGSTTGWYGDHGTAPGGNWDDEYGTWNRNFCDNNNDGPAANDGSNYRYRCCY